jgi:hypothetical protein
LSDSRSRRSQGSTRSGSPWVPPVRWSGELSGSRNGKRQFGEKKTMVMVGAKREGGMIRFLAKIGRGEEEAGQEGTETVIRMESGEREGAGPEGTGSVVKMSTGEREGAGPGLEEDRARGIIPENVYIIFEKDGSKYSRFVGENVIRGISLKMENVIKVKSDEVIM